MALVVNDRVKETSTTTGTGTFSLAGAVSGFETFVAGIGNTNTTYYTIVNTDGAFEVGIGTVTDAATDTLSRDTILSSSNSDNAVDFAAGTKQVFCTLPASKAVIKDASNNVTLPADFTVDTNTLHVDSTNNTVGIGTTSPGSDTLVLSKVANHGLKIERPASGANPGSITLQVTSNGSGILQARRSITMDFDDSNLGTQSFQIHEDGTEVFKIGAGGIPTINQAYTLPNADGSANQVLTTDGSGAVTFQTPTTGDITAVTAGSGLTGGGASGDVTLNIGAGTGVTVNADDIAIGQDVATSASPTFAAVNVTNTSTGDSLLITTTEDTSTAAPVITLKRNSSSPADGDYLGQLKFKGENDADQEVIYAKITGKISDVTDTTEDGLIEFALRKAGSNNIGARLTSTELKLINGTGLEVGGYTFPTSDGSANQVLQTDGSGSLSFATISADITGVTAGNGLTGGGSSGDVSLAVGAGTGIDVAADSISIDLSELTTSTSDGDGDFFAVVDAANAQKKLTKANINISGFNNDSGFTTNTGTVTSVSGGNGLTGTVTTSGSLAVGAGTLIDVTADAVSVDLSELTTSTSDADGDFFVVVDSANAQKKLTKGNINISGFNNDAGYTSNTGDITGVTAGSGLTGGGSSGGVTLNVGAGTGIDVTADAIAVDVSDFMTNGSNNRIVTATGTDGQNAEANLTFDGSTLDVSGTLLTDKGYIAETTLTDGATINWDMSTQSVCKVTLGGNRTMAAPTNGSTGQFASITVIQDGTGSRTLTWNAVYEFASDTAPTLSTTANKADLFVFRYNGSKWLEVGRNLLLTVS